jgi:hypothetical protein
LRKAGAEHVIIDFGQIAPEVRPVSGGRARSAGLIGTATLLDSLNADARRVATQLAQRVDAGSRTMPAIPSTVRLTTYTTHIVTAANSTAPLQRIVRAVEEGGRSTSIASSASIRSSRRIGVEEDRATGKLVVVVD